jgi:nitroreductase
MTLAELVRTARSVRRFDEAAGIDMATLEELVDLARLTSSAGNLQPLRYVLCTGERTTAAVFATLKWAAHLKDWPGPAAGERPAGYIIICTDTTVATTVDCDHGIAAQTIMLGAVERGLGACILGSINIPRLQTSLGLGERHKPLLVIALGRPAERVVLETVEESVAYWRDDAGVHHVPKRELEAVVVGRYAE